jgi:hypothetical protein
MLQADDIHQLQNSPFTIHHSIFPKLFMALRSNSKRDKHDSHHSFRYKNAVKFLYACKDQWLQYHNALILCKPIHAGWKTL